MPTVYAVENKTGLLYRKDTYDLFVLSEQKKEYKELFKRCENQVVLDIGGNCGYFAHYCVENNCKKVISFEPDPENFEVLKNQDYHKKNKSECFNVAIGPKKGTIELYINKNKNKGMHSVFKVNGRKPIEVPMRSFNEVLKKYKPKILKMDIEGAEFLLDWNIFPSNIDLIAMEIGIKTKFCGPNGRVNEH